MGRTSLVSLAFIACLTACGGGGGEGGGGSGNPTPTPSPTVTPTPSPAPTPQVSVNYVHVFMSGASDGGQPNGPLLQASDGNFYGTTRAGGANTCGGSPNFCGVLFKMIPSGTVTILHSFGASASDGNSPSAPLVQGVDGALYGLTSFGGSYGGGTAYRITLAGDYSTIYSFGDAPAHGAVPTGGLTVGHDGHLYGTTTQGGTNHCADIPIAGGNCGTAFRLTTSGVHTVLHSFGASPTDGVLPNGSLLQAPDGNFYGTTSMGGGVNCSSSPSTSFSGCGALFRMTPDGNVTVIHSFGKGYGTDPLYHDGIAPQGPVILGADGALYGTTPSGGQGRCGTFYGCGVVYRSTLSGTVTILREFAVEGQTGGYGPGPFIVQGKDGLLYGTTNSGGANGGDLAGVAFRLSTSGGGFTTLYSFGPLNSKPHNPGGLMQAADGSFYGIVAYSGDVGAGSIFRMTVN